MKILGLCLASLQTLPSWNFFRGVALPFFFFFDLSLNLSSTYLIITGASRWCFLSFSLRWSCIIVMETLTVFLMQVKLAKSHSASHLAYGIQVQDEKCQEFFLFLSPTLLILYFWFDSSRTLSCYMKLYNDVQLAWIRLDKDFVFYLFIYIK